MKKLYNSIAEHFDKTRYKPWKGCLYFINKIPKNSLVLDLGCGNGRNSIPLIKKGVRVIGLDSSRELLKLFKKKIDCELIEGDVRNIPFKDSYFDYILYIAVIHHLLEKDRIKSLKELKRVLKPNGHALINVWIKEQERFKDESSQDVYVTWNKKHKRFYHLFKKGELEELVKKVGLRIIKSFMSENNYYVEVKKI